MLTGRRSQSPIAKAKNRLSMVSQNMQGIKMTGRKLILTEKDIEAVNYKADLVCNELLKEATPQSLAFLHVITKLKYGVKVV